MSSQCSKGVLLWQAVPQLVGGRGQVNHTASPPIGKLEELSVKVGGLGGQGSPSKGSGGIGGLHIAILLPE